MLLMKDIIDEYNPHIRVVCDEVPFPLSAENKKVIDDLLEYIINSNDAEIAEKYDLRESVGIAAPQIDVPLRMCAVHTEDENGKMHSYQFINPRIVSHSEERAYLKGGEGCLSVNREVEGVVPRYARVTIEYTDVDGKQQTVRLRNYVAIVAQHELDHLDGVLFFDHIRQDQLHHVPGAKEIDLGAAIDIE